MLNEDLEIYGSCDLEKPKIPPRSRLYYLEPIGIGTPYVESLTSFLMRLANAHSLEVNTLVAREISSYLDRGYIQDNLSKGLSTLFNRGAALNSNGILAAQLCQSLEKLTFRKDLSLLTLLLFDKTFSSRKLLRKSKAWCSACCEQWRISGKTVYEPLLWTLESVKVCSEHLQPLKNICPHCDRSLPWLTGRSKVGYCSKCNRWLGSFLQNHHNQNESELSEYIWIAQSLGELISSIPLISSSVQSANISQAFNLIIDATCEGNIAAFAKIFGLPKNTVWMWCKGKSIPELRMILTVCYRLEISLLDFVTLKPQAFKSPQINPQRLSNTLLLNKRSSPKAFDYISTENYLQNVLNNLELPPLTMKEVAQKLKINQRTIYGYFPSLCKAISAKSRNYKKQQTAQRIQKCCQEVEQAVHDIYKSGEYPSEARVSKLISQPGYFRYKEVRNSLNRAMLNLGI
ncbi:MAG: TniQ family protein [Xenococcaceae cyanobacterium MO_188.B29]|nr:TniQ family protein [Xenococcaceae cyanobacterium MO_188.B29]